MVKILSKIVETYPVRYEAYDPEGVICINANPKESGGNEWMVWRDHINYAFHHIAIESYQDKHLRIEYVRDGFCIFRDTNYYKYFGLLLIRAVKIIQDIYSFKNPDISINNYRIPEEPTIPINPG